MLPELVVIRFVVLDDEYIGDDFIGQYTIPFECLKTGIFSHSILDFFLWNNAFYEKKSIQRGCHLLKVI